MSEYPENACENAYEAAFELDLLRNEPPHDRLSRCQSCRLQFDSSFVASIVSSIAQIGL